MASNGALIAGNASKGTPAPAKKAAKAATAKPAAGPKPFTKEEDLRAYRDMLLIRRFEEKAGQLYGMGLIGGFCHLYIGQEAVVVGMQMATIQGDQVITGYRDHGHMLACGMEANGVGRADWPQGRLFARQGRLDAHVQPRKAFYGGHGIVGAQVALGTGLAFANRYTSNGNVSLAYFGDGAANQGQVYESFNMAELWSLPVVYIIENNRYAMGTAVSRASAQQDFSKRGVSFNIPGEQVDGMDVQAVREAGLRAIEHARSGKGPYILEMQTTAIAATPCPTRRSIAPRTKWRRCATSTTRSSRCATAFSASTRSPRRRSRRSMPRSARSSMKARNSRLLILSRMSPSSGPTS